MRKELTERHQNETASVKQSLSNEIEALQTEIDQLKSNKMENEKHLLDKNIQLNNQLKRMDESLASAQAALKQAEEALHAKQRQADECLAELRSLREKADQEDAQLRESDEKCSAYLKQINELSESLNAAYFDKIRVEKEMREAIETAQASLIADREEQLEAARGREAAHNRELAAVKQQLANAEIDLASMKDKVNEGLRDYRTSIDKLKQANNQRAVKMKKKLVNCQTVLGLIEKNLFQMGEEDNGEAGSSKPSSGLFTQFLNTLIESKKQEQGGPNDSTVTVDTNVNDENASSVATVSLEFDENRFRELIENKRQEIERLRNFSSLESVANELNETVAKLREELSAVKASSARAESKLKVNIFLVKMFYYRFFYQIFCYFLGRKRHGHLAVQARDRRSTLEIGQLRFEEQAGHFG
jgi:chromosome segregation ATPase